MVVGGCVGGGGRGMWWKGGVVVKVSAGIGLFPADTDTTKNGRYTCRYRYLITKWNAM